MSRKLSTSALKSLIREQVRYILTEEDSKPAPKVEKDSLDKQIDDFFIEYESEAKTKKNEGLDFRSMTRNFLTKSLQNLFEAEEGEEEKPEGPAASPEGEAKEEKKKLTAEDIDIESFATDVVRLIDNYDSLLEVRNTIARRAVNFLSKNYEESVANQFKITLEDEHDIAIGKSKEDEDFEKFQAPFADRAGGSGGGGA